MDTVDRGTSHLSDKLEPSDGAHLFIKRRLLNDVYETTFIKRRLLNDVTAHPFA
jgi:hypothetical protein